MLLFSLARRRFKHLALTGPFRLRGGQLLRRFREALAGRVRSSFELTNPLAQPGGFFARENGLRLFLFQLASEIVARSDQFRFALGRGLLPRLDLGGVRGAARVQLLLRGRPRVRFGGKLVAQGALPLVESGGFARKLLAQLLRSTPEVGFVRAHPAEIAF